jgi:hypothetical protein
MSSLIAALDNYTQKQLGENEMMEYTWSNNIQEKIVQIHTQLVRTDVDQTQKIKKELHDVLFELKTILSDKKITSEIRDKNKEYLSILYRMIGQTRDIKTGKGEYELTYMMIHVWYQFYPSLAEFAVRCFVLLTEDNSIHPYGSWKDIRYLCEYFKNQGEPENHPFILFCANLTNTQLKKDYDSYVSKSNKISLTAKWAPRERRFKWLNQIFATNYFSEYIKSANSKEQYKKAFLKCITHYRQLCSQLNKYIETVQTFQCAKQWQNIDFNKVTSITLSKQSKAFSNKNKNGTIRYQDNEDRIICSQNYENHIQRAKNGCLKIKGKCVSMVDFAKQACKLIDCNIGQQLECDRLNLQWSDNETQTSALDNFVAMVDVSASMTSPTNDPMMAAISLGIRIANKSKLGKRVMTFSQVPTWVNLQPYDNFVDQVRKVRFAKWGANTNFMEALYLILDAIVEKKLPAEEVKNMVLVILSDMQMDAADKHDKKTLFETMKAEYSEAGLKVHGVPYEIPFILFWNLRSTNGFPTLSTNDNCAMMSGFEPALLNVFCDKGIDALRSSNPWSILVDSLANERYKILDEKLNHELYNEFNNIKEKILYEFEGPIGRL